MAYFDQFGGKLTKELLNQYQQSKNWKKGSFQNLEPTSLSFSPFKIPGIIYKQLSNRSERAPKKSIPLLPFNKNDFLAPAPEAKFIWYGHSSLLMRMNNKSILVDPMLGPDTTPIAPFPTKRFSENTLSIIDDFPEIDLLLMTHDHYDHLDYSSIQKLKLKTKKYFVALGVKRHLVAWGIAPDLITEFDWWDSKTWEDITITFTPTRHFSGRGLTDRLKSLWGGWVFKIANENIWFSGDGGYGKHFKEIGERLGPFDFAFIECGQYNDDWRPVHLFPEESVQAAIDAKVKKAMPVHWAGFALSYQHAWTAPAEEFVKAALDKNLEYSIPALGKHFNASAMESEKWWLSFSYR
ncbi:MAG: L-ascorbate metabolism protein UlaG (beta-lactamase superfamily) [Saprospiraceae bacterium]|jgi:L-ascorbate metabolism protein UlaG (beta-lactamase superfamily)